jgi:hypothetical protein
MYRDLYTEVDETANPLVSCIVAQASACGGWTL